VRRCADTYQGGRAGGAINRGSAALLLVFAGTLKGCHFRVPITEAEFWQLQAYQVRLFCCWFTVLSGIPISAFTMQKEQRRADRLLGSPTACRRARSLTPGVKSR